MALGFFVHQIKAEQKKVLNSFNSVLKKSKIKIRFVTASFRYSLHLKSRLWEACTRTYSYTTNEYPICPYKKLGKFVVSADTQK